MVSRGNARGGPYSIHCQPCSDRHSAAYLEFVKTRDAYWKLKEELEALIRKYSGRRAPKMSDKDWRDSKDARKFRDGMKRLWSMPTPQPPKPQEFHPADESVEPVRW